VADGSGPVHSARCIACHADGLHAVESASVGTLAEAWHAEQRRRTPGALVADISAEAIARTLGSTTVRIDRCPRCGLEAGWPRRAWIEGAYHGASEYPRRWEFEALLRDLGDTRHSILEIGCGAGAFLRMAHERGHRALGIDLNREAVAAARRQGLDAVTDGFDGLRARLAAAGAASVFDAIAMFHVIEHVDEMDAFLADVATFSARGTKLAVSCPGPRRYTHLIDEERLGNREYWDYPPHHVTRWTLPALQNLLGSHGWRVVQAREEPLDRVGAASHIAITRAIDRGYVDRKWRRRLAIAHALLRVAVARRIRGLSIYVLAERVGR
jgi:2-polyprenyl-3-methyl-5-hydroxy-6-metoxy-1,4-benzoquinol methylase